nr:cilia- and flagella-associated protein 61-like isoform X1 [Halyomorpha halys]
MTVPRSEFNFLDSSLKNYDSFSDASFNYFPRNMWEADFMTLRRYSSDDGMRHAEISFQLTPIQSWRRAEHTDIQAIELLCMTETESIYGCYSVADLVESSLLPVVLLNELKVVVAFVAIQDYPHVPFLPTSDWEQWLDEMYQVRMFNSLNTRFIHLMVWNVHYERIFMKNILSKVFAEDPYVEYILHIMPFGMPLKQPYKGFFNHYLSITDLANERRSVRKIREFKEKYLLGMYVALRIHIGPNVVIRPAKNSDSELITKSIFDQLPGMKLMFSNTLYKDLMNESEDEPNKRKILIGEYKNEDKELGIMTYREEVDLKLITKYYNTFLYHGFRFLKDIKKWNSIYSQWNKANSDHPLEQFNRTVRSESFIDQNVNTQSMCTDETCFETRKPSQKGKLFSVVEQAGEMTPLDRDFSISKMNHDRVLVKKAEDVIKVDTNFAKRREICLSYANEEKVILKMNEIDEELEKIEQAYAEDNHETEESRAMEIEFYVPGKNQDIRLVHNYLKYIFEHSPVNKHYILIAVASHDHYQPILHYCELLDRKRRTYGNRDLFVCFKLAFTGLFLVREAEMTDFEEIMALTIRNPHYHQIHKDVFTILRGQTNRFAKVSPLKCYVFICCNTLIGFAVVGQENDMDYLVGNYNVEDFIFYSVHKRDAHGFVRHFVLITPFLHLTTYFLRSIMRQNFWTTLYAYIIPGHLMLKYPEFSILSGIEYWIPVQPRRLPKYWKEGLGNLTPYGRIIRENMHPFALYHMNYKMAGIQKKLYTTKIVVVGGGELALSFLEHLIFSPSSWYSGYKSITLISQGGLPTKFEEQYDKYVKMMTVSSNKYNEEYLGRLSLDTWVDMVDGIVTSIDRKQKFLLVDEEYDFDYDYLFLFCGTQFSKPQSVAELMPKKECRVVIDEIKGVENKHSNRPENLFTINSDTDAFYMMLSLKEIFDKKEFERDSKIVIYGHCLNALACIAGLLEFGMKSSFFVLVEPASSPSENIDYAYSTQVYNSIKATLQSCQLEAYYQFSFSCYETEENPVTQEKRITKVHFQSQNRVISFAGIALISFEPKTVNYLTRLAIQKACLTFDGKLVIDSNFLTNDKNIYAAGSLTRYKKKYYCDHYNHENYCSHEIGAEIAYRFQKRIQMEESGQAYLNINRSVTEFTHPIVVSCKLPGGWNYLHVTKPGPMFFLQTINSKKPWGRTLETGNAFDRQGPGYFRIIINHFQLVCDILCFTTKEIDIHNMICLYNKHESLLNQLLLRWKGDLITDLYFYFREPWAYALYHDRFPLFMEEIQTFYLNMIEDEQVTFYEAVAYSFNICKWQKISEKDKELLEDLFKYVPELKSAIEKKLTEFLDYNENLLTTYLTTSKLERYQNFYLQSRMYDTEHMDRGRMPLVPTQPDYIVPTPGNRKELEDRMKERSMTEIVFKVPSDIEKESQDKLSQVSSVDSIEPNEITYVPEDAVRDAPYLDIDLRKLCWNEDMDMESEDP